MSTSTPDLKRFIRNPYARRLVISAGLAFVIPALAIGGFWLPTRLAESGSDYGAAAWPPLLVLVGIGLACITGLAIALYKVPFRKHEQAQWELIEKLPKPEQLGAVQRELQASQEQIQVMLDDNIRLREEISGAKLERATTSRLLETVVSTTDDPIVVTDASARIVNLSQPAAVLLGVRVEEVIGTDSFRVLRFFDAYKEKPEEYPLLRLIEDVVERASSVPFMTDVILLDSRHHSHRIMLTSQAIVRADNKVAGTLLRFQPSQGESNFAGAIAQSSFDSSTDLPTRGEFMRRLTELINIAQAQQRHHELLLFSVDELQGIYDRFGYWAGEELLWKVASLIRKEVGGQPELFRITSVHFALVLPFSTPNEADAIAERLRECVEIAQFSWHENDYRATISIGQSSINGQASTPSAVISMADEYLRTARDAGGNQALRYQEDGLLVETQAIEQQLLSWLNVSGDTEHLQLHSREFKAAAESGMPPLVEAMLRVEMDDGFWIDAAAFRSSASNSGLSHKLDLWLLQHGAEAFVDSATKAAGSRLIVPCSGQSLQNEDFATTIEKILLESGLEPSLLVLAIEERHARSYTSEVSRFRKALKNLNVGFALTDCRVAALGDVIRQLRPAYVGLPAATLRRLQDPAIIHELRYFRESAADARFELFIGNVTENAQAQELYHAGVNFVGDAGSALGPLSAFAGLRMPD